MFLVTILRFHILYSLLSLFDSIVFGSNNKIIYLNKFIVTNKFYHFQSFCDDNIDLLLSLL